ncbi:MAG: putative secreted protein [Anaerocolumna sp.]|jgi:D-alanyl-D-alanine carboxypeptidase|nr:putative secreted protein [Anaerocolumna sp.]
MKKLFTLLCLVSLLFYNTAPAQAQSNTETHVNDTATSNASMWPENSPEVFSEAAIVMEASTGAILYSKNVHDSYYPASITKILTALIAIENSSLGETVTFSREAIFDVDLDSSRIGIDVDEELTMEQSLYGILLESANEVSYAIAEHVAGDVASFADMMNQKAKELGATDTNFVNPHGLPDPNHYTSAYDMALISRAAINNDTFREISSSRTYIIPPTNIQEETRYLNNHHKFVKGSINFDGAIGGKTGYTSKAKYTLVTYAERNGMTLISVIMSCDTIAHEYEDTAKILNYGFDNFSIYNIADMENPYSIEPSPLFTKYNSLLNTNNSALHISKEGNIILPSSASFEDAEKKIMLSQVDGLIEGDNIIGTISYEYDGKYVGSSDIIFNNSEYPTLGESSILPLDLVFPSEEDDSEEAITSTNTLTPIIIGIIITFFVLGIGLYVVFIEIPYRRRRSSYHRKRERRRKASDTSYIDI